MSTKLTTNWMWQDEVTTGVMGAVVDPDDLTVQWFDEPGCACTDSDSIQTVQDFLARGPKSITSPDDILREMHENLSKLVENSVS